MIAKARFSVSKKDMTQILNTYMNGSRFSNFLIQPNSVLSEQCEVVGKSQEIMFLIGHIASIGEDTLISFNAV